MVNPAIICLILLRHNCPLTFGWVPARTVASKEIMRASMARTTSSSITVNARRGLLAGGEAANNGARDVPARSIFGYSAAAEQSETCFATEAVASRDVSRSVVVVPRRPQRVN